MTANGYEKTKYELISSQLLLLLRRTFASINFYNTAFLISS